MRMVLYSDLFVNACIADATHVRRLPENHVPDCDGFSFAFKECWQEHSGTM